MSAENFSSDLPVVAAFDFDGTLTTRDSLLPFLLFTQGPVKTFGKLSLELPSLGIYLFGYNTRQSIKEKVITRFFRGVPIEEMRKKGERFAAKALDKIVRPEGIKRIQWHQKQGHRCILVSASIDVYLEPWAKRMGFQDILTTRLEVDVQGLVTGRLLGPNCWGPEKTCRLKDLLGPREGYILYAYGDSRGDRELLASADYAFYRHMP